MPLASVNKDGDRMRVIDKQINKTFYDYEPGECFVDEYGNYYMKIRDVVKLPDGSRSVVYKAINLQNGLTDDYEDNVCLRPVNAEVVIE